MSFVSVSWYLCVLCTAALLVASAVTIAPGGETAMRTEIGIVAGCAVLFAATGLALKWFGISGPKWLLLVYQGFAALATVAVLLLVAG